MDFFSNTEKDKDVDTLNDETFGVGDDVSELNDDWEIQHNKLAQFLEHEKIKQSSPLHIHKHHQSYGSFYGKERHDLSDDEEVIIESSISQLGLDDDSEETNMIRESGRSFEFKESKESWMSPPRTNDTKPDSLKELISPGEGVWSSPSRGLLRDGDQIVPELNRRSKQEDENIIKKLFGGHDLKTGKSANEKGPSLKPITVEDLEKGLRKDSDPTRPNITERHAASPVAGPPGFNPPPGFSAPNMGSPLLRMVPPMAFSPMVPGVDLNVNPLLMMSPQLAAMKGMSPMVRLTSPIGLIPASMTGRPYLMNSPRQEHRSFEQRGQRGGNRGRFNSPRYHNNSNRSWNRNENRDNKERYWSKEKREQPEPLIEMQPSKMMTSKEKEWIFKIMMMSLLSGDFITSDYYFINYMKNQALKESISKQESEEENRENKEEKEKAKNLVSYAQKHQQTKESHKPVKFEGSLGKLSITSVHHPRQIMDLSTPEKESTTVTRVQESGRKRYLMYGMVEKMYELYLNAIDIDDKLVDMSPEEQQDALTSRKEKIDKLFEMLKVELHTSSEQSDSDHFLHVLSICKARKLLTRTILIFSQIQSESLLVTVIHVLPALLKKDNRDQALRDFPEKVKVFLNKSEENFKLKCLKMLRKINLKMLLSYQMSACLLTEVLDSLADKNPEHNIDWSYYFCEVPRVSIELPPEIFRKNDDIIQRLKNVLGASDILISID